ncbi:helix-turn-helix domain-containing protein [Donghicola sp. XS_ASV15]|uniref:helix-turn-helix domain-containing protein n=1 Tax=Donghicola sp. XS_ASV15 TaxID=3241295 RepID=UPI0035183690
MKMNTKTEGMEFLDQLEKALVEENPNVEVELRKFEDFEKGSREIRQALKKIRELRNMSQQEVGSLISVSASGVSKMESGAGDIGILSLFRYANALGYNLKISLEAAVSSPEIQEESFSVSNITDTVSGVQRVNLLKLSAFHQARIERMQALTVEIGEKTQEKVELLEAELAKILVEIQSISSEGVEVDFFEKEV